MQDLLWESLQLWWISLFLCVVLYRQTDLCFQLHLDPPRPQRAQVLNHHCRLSNLPQSFHLFFSAQIWCSKNIIKFYEHQNFNVIHIPKENVNQPPGNTFLFWLCNTCSFLRDYSKLLTRTVSKAIVEILQLMELIINNYFLVDFSGTENLPGLY